MLLRAQRDGIRIVWATGRDLPHFATVREALYTDIFAQNFYIALNGALIVNCGIGAEQRTDGFAADNVDPFLQIADAYDLEALSYTRNGCFRYAQPGFPKASRAVGSACHRNPLCIVVPCHRVIGADGSLPGYAEGLDIKEYLLELERF